MLEPVLVTGLVGAYGLPLQNVKYLVSAECARHIPVLLAQMAVTGSRRAASSPGLSQTLCGDSESHPPKKHKRRAYVSSRFGAELMRMFLTEQQDDIIFMAMDMLNT